jgi:hypothetical protein
MRGSPFGEGTFGRMARELGPLRPRPRKPSLHWPVGRASRSRGATLTLVAPASESPLAFIVVAAGRLSLLHASNHTVQTVRGWYSHETSLTGM